MEPDEVVEKIVGMARDQVVRLSEQLAGSHEEPWSSKNTVVPVAGGRRAEIEVRVRVLPERSEQSEAVGAV